MKSTSYDNGDRITRLSRIAKGTLLSFLLALCIFTVNGSTEAKKRVTPTGETLFKQSCASCHPGGGNVHKSEKTITNSKKLASIVTFKSYLELPPGHMPHYKHIVSDPQTLKALYDYCKTLQKKPSKQASLPSSTVAFFETAVVNENK